MMILRISLTLLVLSVVIAGNIFAFDKFHGHQGVEVPNFDSLYNVASDLKNSSEGQAMMSGCISAYGGKEKLKMLKSYQLDWRMAIMMSGDSADLTRSYGVNREYRVDKKTAIKSETRILNGNKAWFQNTDTSIYLNSGRYKAELYSWVIMGMPLTIETEFSTEKKFHYQKGDSLAWLFMQKPDSMMVILGIDPEDHLIKAAAGKIMQGDQNFLFVNNFGDYKEVEGFMIPHSLINISMGLTVGRSTLKKVTINPDLSDKYFTGKAKQDTEVSY